MASRPAVLSGSRVRALAVLVLAGITVAGGAWWLAAGPAIPASAPSTPTSSEPAVAEVAAAASPDATSLPPDGPIGEIAAWPGGGEDLGPLAPFARPSSTPVDPRVAHHVPVLTYHVIAPWSVAKAYSTADLDVSPEHFEAHLAALRDAGWRTITAQGLAEALATGRTPPPRTFVITIDDGYDDGFTWALPVLRRYGFIATYFVVTGRLDTPTHLSWDQLAALQAAGMEIGNHTVDHVPLTSRTPVEVAHEVGAAQLAIEAHLGSPAVSFAYPFGNTSAAVATAVRNAGLALAFTTQGGTTETWATRYTLPRIHVGATLTAPSLLSVMATWR